jgi:4-alpha-glucanotransferase
VTSSEPGGPAPVSDRLAALAADHGVATRYLDQRDREVTVAASSVEAVLRALGVDPDAPPEPEPDALPPVLVFRRSDPPEVTVGGNRVVRLTGEAHHDLDPVAGRVRLPAGLPVGWYELRVDDRTVPVCAAPDALPRGPRAWGWMTQLYGLRSAASWGVGDLADLTRLATWTGEHGGGVVLVNPLHAVAPGLPVEPSPYFPASRRWTNPLYLCIEQIPAYDRAPDDVRRQVDELRASLPGVDSDRVERDPAWAAKSRALELLHPYAEPEWARVDDALQDFATWCALTEEHGRDWRTWPEELRRPGTPQVRAEAERLAGRVAFHAWVQRCCEAQLASAQQAAVDAGMAVGVVHDLAVGCDPAGADAWAWQDALALDASIGAPPDPFNQQGQDWGLPPWHPRRLAESGYAPLRELVRGLLRHAGGVRIDHILGMFRAWWVPAGAGARDGTFVSYDADAMLGVIATEAHLAGAVVVGEDLGTTPPSVPPALAGWGVLGSSVLWFEREDPVDGEAGGLRPLPDWREAAMASVTTHDLPTALGWLRGEHVRVRAELGLLDDPDAEERTWERERVEMVAALQAAGLVGDEPGEAELVRALHLAVAATPSRYVLAALADALGELRQPNLPGTTDTYPNWRLPLADSAGRSVGLDDALADPRVARLAGDLGAALRGGVR